MIHSLLTTSFIHIESLRSLLYPLGFLSSFAFASRFLIQWYHSERLKQSVVPPIFWKLSLTGNVALMIHSFIQLQFPMYLLQSLHIVLAWRNLNFMGKNPVRLKTVLCLLAFSASTATGLYYLQSFFLPPSSFAWIRSPHQIFIPMWLHLLGTIGIMTFSLRFWIQWIETELYSKSILGKPFWWISLAGAGISATYFFAMRDWVNIVGPLLGIIPYVRNLLLIRQKELNDKRGQDWACHTKNPIRSVAIIAGELSGDEIGAKIAQSLKKKRPQLKIVGVCGPKMVEAGVESWFSIVKLQVMGFSDVLKKLPSIWKASFSIIRHIRAEKPDMIIFIDQPSFSSHLARRIRSDAIAAEFTPPFILQVVAPSVWAYKPERVQRVKNNFDAIFPLYRFETPYFCKHLKTIWIGHPFLENFIDEPQEIIAKKKEEAFPLVAIYPGSRPKEIERNLPLQIDIFTTLNEKWEAKRGENPASPRLRGAIQLAGALDKKQIERVKELVLARCSTFKDQIEFVAYPERHELMKKASCAIAKSGTVTLELALFQTPLIVCYELSGLTYFWAKYVFGVNPNQHFALPNILTKMPIVPEYIGVKPPKDEIANKLLRFLERKEVLFSDETTRLLKDQLLPLGVEKPSEIAARHIIDFLDGRNTVENALRASYDSVKEINPDYLQT